MGRFFVLFYGLLDQTSVGPDELWGQAIGRLRALVETAYRGQQTVLLSNATGYDVM